MQYLFFIHLSVDYLPVVVVVVSVVIDAMIKCCTLISMSCMYRKNSIRSDRTILWQIYASLG